MNDDILDVIEPLTEAASQPERVVEAPRPLVPKRTIVKFKIVDERDNSQGSEAD